jgi:hypothetical protein
MTGGLTLANVVGVPIGSLAGQLTGWCGPFRALAAAVLIMGGVLATYTYITPLLTDRAGTVSAALTLVPLSALALGGAHHPPRIVARHTRARSRLFEGFAEVADGLVAVAGGEEVAEADGGGDRPLDDSGRGEAAQSGVEDELFARREADRADQGQIQAPGTEPLRVGGGPVSGRGVRAVGGGRCTRVPCPVLGWGSRWHRDIPSAGKGHLFPL